MILVWLQVIEDGSKVMSSDSGTSQVEDVLETTIKIFVESGYTLVAVRDKQSYKIR